MNRLYSFELRMSRWLKTSKRTKVGPQVPPSPTGIDRRVVFVHGRARFAARTELGS